MTVKSTVIDAAPEPKGDNDAGKVILGRL